MTFLPFFFLYLLILKTRLFVLTSYESKEILEVQIFGAVWFRLTGRILI